MTCFQLCLMVVASFFTLHISRSVNSEPNSARSLDHLRYKLSSDFRPTEKFGQVTAVTFSPSGNIVIFHRSNVVWNSDSFSADNIYQGDRSSAIAEDTVVELHYSNGQVIKKWGSNSFFMPHGLTIDSTGCFWLTDVALHQVFKFTPNNTKNPSLILGERFKPGSDDEHFCKPTSVAVHSKSKDIYVADGYCNQRVVKFDSKGQFLGKYPGRNTPIQAGYSPNQFNIPHKIILVEEVNSVCVADREHGRIVCFSINDFGNSNAMKPLVISDNFNGLLYSISYAPCSTGLIFAVDGPADRPDTRGISPSVFVISLKTEKLITKFGPDNWSVKYPRTQLHDVISSSDCSQVFTVDVGHNRIWKFESDFFPHGKAAIAAAEVISASPTDESFWSRSSIISMLSLVVIVAVIAVRSFRQPLGAKLSSLRSRFCSRSDTFDLSRLLEDPEKSGFNRVSTTETDMDVDLSDSEVEEFNVSSIRNNHRVTT